MACYEQSWFWQGKIIISTCGKWASDDRFNKVSQWHLQWNDKQDTIIAKQHKNSCAVLEES